jgi:hypothetical protein
MREAMNKNSQEKMRSTRRSVSTPSSESLSITNPQQTTLGLNPNLWDKTHIYRLSYNTASNTVGSKVRLFKNFVLLFAAF